jgi:hypothetical protein
MNKIEVKNILQGISQEVESIGDKKTVTILNTLINLVEMLVEENAQLKKENQDLKDEVNRLKGEQGKPDIKGKNQSADHSSEKERKVRQPKKPRKPRIKKKSVIAVDREVTCELDKTNLPDDLIFKGYETRVVQDLKISTDNVRFKLRTYYSPSLKKTFIAPLPNSYNGQFGPVIKSLIITLYRDSGMTESAIWRFLTAHNITISKSTIALMITEKHEIFHKEKEDIIDAGIKVSPYQHIDDTTCRVSGENQYTHILCSPLYTAFFTRPKKDRLTLLDIMCRGDLRFTINDDTYELMHSFGLPVKRITELKEIELEEGMTRKEIDVLLLQIFPNPKKHSTNRRIILESSALIYYQYSKFWIKFLMCDDAPQFNMLAEHKILCWIHEGRHLKKLNPIYPKNQIKLEDFRDRFWNYYALLLAYRETPSDEMSEKLTNDFDTLFSTKTGYDALDRRISMILDKRDNLILVLKFPFLPLENNPAELGARVQARIRDINLHTISDNGTKTKDTFATIVQTAKKLGVNIYDYIRDRVSKTNEMESLADIISGHVEKPI